MARGGGGRLPRFSKISQKFASVNEDLRSENLPLSIKKSVFTPTGTAADETYKRKTMNPFAGERSREREC